MEKGSPTAVSWSLVYLAIASSRESAQTPDFLIGSQYQNTAPQSGRLYLAFNDTTVAGNFLTYGVTIRTQPLGFKVGDELLLIQMQGDGAGKNETGIIESITPDGQVTLKQPLQNTYTPRPYLGGGTVCQDPNYGGRCETFQPTMDDGFLRDNFVGWSQANNVPSPSSLRIDGDYRVMLYPNTVWRAQSGLDLFTQSDPFLGDNAIGDNRAWSIRVRANNATQIVRVAHYTLVDVQGRLTVHPWDGWTGGILAFRAQQEIRVGSAGTIDVSGTGFIGGITAHENAPGTAGESLHMNGPGFDLISANRGGGGGGQGNYSGSNAVAAAGGGGGGHGTAGSAGQNAGSGAIGGNGGEPYALPEQPLFVPGSGGGSGGGDWVCCEGRNGLGGIGGGVMLLYSPQITLEGTLQAHGADGQSPASPSAGAGGGGAGGGITIVTLALTTAGSPITAVGGQGGASVPSSNGRPSGGGGGNGGNGSIRLLSCGGLLDPNVAVPSAYVAQQDCTPPTAAFTAPAPGYVPYGSSAVLNWRGDDSGTIVSGVRNYTLRQSVGGGPFTDIIANTTELTHAVALSLPCRPITFSIAVIDNAGNNSLTPGTLTLTATLQGDVGLDGSIGADDLALVEAAWGQRLGQQEYQPFLDMTADAQIDAADTLWMRRHLGDRCS